MSKYIAILLCVCLILLLPAGFAADNDTVISLDDTSDVLTTDYYFDGNAADDNGTGTVDSPYKELTGDRIEDNSVIHLANANYTFGDYLSLSNVTFMGSDAEKTVINVDYGDISTYSSLTFRNLTFTNARLEAYGSANLTIDNVIFRDSSDYNGGLIYSSSEESTITISNSVFENNRASNYGGVIYIENGVINISNSIFNNNIADFAAGAIYAKNAAVNIQKSRFTSNKASGDIGGAIYLFQAYLNATDINITGCNAQFGGAIAAISSYMELDNLYAKNNSALYYGGAVYFNYGDFILTSSNLAGNDAVNGAALYIDLSNITVKSNRISDEVYTIECTSGYDSIKDDTLNNTFAGEVFEIPKLNVNIGSANYTYIHMNSPYVSDIPSKYKSPYLTPVKQQGSGGNCWAFTAMAALESAILKETGVAYDLSEDNMKNIMSIYSDYGWLMETNVGGYDDMGYGYLAAWLGPVLESDDEYNAKSLVSPLLDALFHVQNILFIQRNNQTDTTAIKEAILNYGAVGTCIHWSSGTYGKKSSYYCNNENAAANHAVTIVGWDDSYSKNNFKTTAPDDGAWIIKNSWGTGSGDKGYYYVSYYDTVIAKSSKKDSTFAFILNETKKYDKNYQYDIPGRTDYMLNSGDEIWYKVNYNATGNEYLAAVSTYFERITNWTMSVYVNGAVKLTQSGSSQPGYITIDLDSLIALKTGDNFEIMFHVKNNIGEFSVPVSEAISLNYKFYDYGYSFVSTDGENWIDVNEYVYSYTTHTYNSSVVCIKAFTIFDELETSIHVDVSYNSTNRINLEAVVYDSYGNVVKSGEVTFTLDGTTVKAKITDGMARYAYTLKNTDVNVVKATFRGTGYISSQNQTTYEITKIISGDLTSYYGNVTWTVTLQDSGSKAMANKKVKFILNGRNYTATTDSKGKASINTKLDIGNYSVKSVFAGEGKYVDVNVENTINAISTVGLSSKTQYYVGDSYEAIVFDSNGDRLANANVNVGINQSAYTVKSGSQGVISKALNLKHGSYTVMITNPKTGEKVTQKIAVNPIETVISSSDVTCYYSNVVFTVTLQDSSLDSVAGRKIRFSVNGNDYNVNTDKNGKATLKLDLDVGKYYIESSFDGDDTYQNSSAVNEITVKSTIDLPGETKYTFNAQYSPVFYDSNGNRLANADVNVVIGDETYSASTDSNGKLSIKIDLNPGTYGVNVVNPNTNEELSQTVKVVSRITGNKDLTMYYTSGKSFKVRVYDDNGNPADGVSVKFKINGRTYTKTSDSNGYASLKISLKPGTYTIKATYKGFTVSNKVVIKTTLITKDITVKKGKTIKFTAKVLNTNGKVLKNKKVTFKFKGKTYNVKTNSKGKATVKITKKYSVGKHTITTVYSGLKNKNKIKISK